MCVRPHPHGVYPGGNRGKTFLALCPNNMPIVALIVISLAVGALVAFAASRYPFAGQRPAHAAAGQSRPGWSAIRALRLVRERLDPATATGLALTLALGLAVVGGVLIGSLPTSYQRRDLGARGLIGRSVGVDNATSWVRDMSRPTNRETGHYQLLNCSSEPCVYFPHSLNRYRVLVDHSVCCFVTREERSA